MHDNTIDVKGLSVHHQMQVFTHWMNDPDVTEICVNRPHEIFCEISGRWTRHEEKTLGYAKMQSLATAVARYADNDISDTRPILSAKLPNGERVQFVLPPACEAGTISMTIRKPSFSLRTLEAYKKSGFFDRIEPISEDLSKDEQELLHLKNEGKYEEFLKKAISLEKVIIVAGETGSGKTTFMKTLMQEIPVKERIITIEDVPELFLPNHPNHVHLFYPSEAKEEENAPVTSASLLKSCLRMKPNRILLAELRGGEAFDFVNVCASGHGGSITSIHAGSCTLAFERLVMMILQNRQGRTLSYDVIKRLLYNTIDIIIHMHNDPERENGRHITEIWYDPMKKRQA